jgi:cell division protein ZapA
MAQVQLTVNGRIYAVACEDGQEANVLRLGRYIEQKVAGLAKTVGQVGDARLMLMAGLLVADELSDTELQLNQARTELSRAAKIREQSRVAAERAVEPADEILLTRTLDGLAHRIEAIAAGLQRD